MTLPPEILLPLFLNIGTRTLVSIDVVNKWNPVRSGGADHGRETVLFLSATTPAFDSTTVIIRRTSPERPRLLAEVRSSGSYEVDGYSYQADTIFATGWNLVGSIFEPIPVSAVATAPRILTSEFYRYANGYQIADSIAPGKGYWQSSQAGDMYFTVLPAAAPKPRAGQRRIQQHHHHRRRVRLQNALLCGRRRGARKTALPPKPPKGAFDVRFADETSFARSVRIHRGESRAIVIESAEPELRLMPDPEIDDTRYFIKDATGGSHAITDGAALTLTPAQDGSTTIARRRGGNIPPRSRWSRTIQIRSTRRRRFLRSRARRW